MRSGSTWESPARRLGSMTAPVRLLSSVAVLFGGLLLSHCETPGGTSPEEGPQASVRVEFASRYNIERSVGLVLQSRGYRLVATSAGGWTFERPGGGRRVEILLTNPDFALHRLHADVFEWQSSGAAGQGRWVEAAGGKAEARDLLKDVKRLAGAL